MPQPFSPPCTGLPRWKLGSCLLLPIVQGGMGIGVSAHRLAGSVARLGALGTISSVELRHHHPDLLEQSCGCRDKATLDRLNLTALNREIRAALAIAAGCGAVAVNVMKAVTQYAAYVRQSCESAAHAIVMGAGLPLDLPDMTRDFPEVALIPILSDVRGIAIVLKKWLRKNRLPDAIDAAARLGIDAIIFGTGTRFGNMTAQMRNLLDQTGGLWMSGALVGKVGSVFTSTASQHGGQETTITSFHTTLLHHGMIIVGVPYAEQRLVEKKEVSGGTPYGASTLTGADGSRLPSENELAIARYQGRHVATIASALQRGRQ